MQGGLRLDSPSNSTPGSENPRQTGPHAACPQAFPAAPLTAAQTPVSGARMDQMRHVRPVEYYSATRSDALTRYHTGEPWGQSP